VKAITGSPGLHAPVRARIPQPSRPSAFKPSLPMPPLLVTYKAFCNKRSGRRSTFSRLSHPPLYLPASKTLFFFSFFPSLRTTRGSLRSMTTGTWFELLFQRPPPSTQCSLYLSFFLSESLFDFSLFQKRFTGGGDEGFFPHQARTRVSIIPPSLPTFFIIRFQSSSGYVRVPILRDLRAFWVPLSPSLASSLSLAYVSFSRDIGRYQWKGFFACLVFFFFCAAPPLLSWMPQVAPNFGTKDT